MRNVYSGSKTMIREYRDDDFSQVFDVFKSLESSPPWPEYFPNGWQNETLENEVSTIRKYGGGRMYVSIKNNTVCGFVGMHVLTDFVTNEISHLQTKLSKVKDAYYLRNIVVHKDFQGGSHALRLCRTFQQEAMRSNYSHLVTRTPPKNNKGINFFQTVGFKQLFADDFPQRVYL